MDSKLTEYLASSPHCKLEFCRQAQAQLAVMSSLYPVILVRLVRLNQGWPLCHDCLVLHGLDSLSAEDVCTPAGRYQFRHVDYAVETKCLEVSEHGNVKVSCSYAVSTCASVAQMSIVNGKLMVKLEPTSHDRGWHGAQSFSCSGRVELHNISQPKNWSCVHVFGPVTMDALLLGTSCRSSHDRGLTCSKSTSSIIN